MQNPCVFAIFDPESNKNEQHSAKRVPFLGTPFWKGFGVSFRGFLGSLLEPLGALGGALGALWGTRGAFEPSLGSPWGFLGTLWLPLAPLWESWGGLWTIFGAFWEVKTFKSVVLSSISCVFVIFGKTEKRAVLGAKGGSHFQFPGLPKPLLFARLLLQGTCRYILPKKQPKEKLM